MPSASRSSPARTPTLVPRILDGLKENGAEDVLVVAGHDSERGLRGAAAARRGPGLAPGSRNEIVDFLKEKVTVERRPVARGQPPS